MCKMLVKFLRTAYVSYIIGKLFFDDKLLQQCLCYKYFRLNFTEHIYFLIYMQI